MDNQQLNIEEKMDKNKFDDKLKQKFKGENYTVIYYGKNSKENSIIRCLDCGRNITVNTGELFRTRRKHICSKCHYKRVDTIRNEEIIRERLKDKSFNIEFYMQKRNGINHNMVRYTCNKCGKVNNKEVGNFLRQIYDCSFCEGNTEAKDHDIFLKQLHDKYGNKFEVLNTYIKATENIKIRCTQCNFIRDIKPNALLLSGYCPKCDKKASKGEKIIQQYLDSNNISYETQVYFKEWGIGVHYFDFFIPQYNLLIEYNGIQHYQYTPHFHKDNDDFITRKNKDNIKKETALKNSYNYISISYKCYQELESILNTIFNSTTIPIGSRGKCLEIETIQDILDEDIVCSL